MRSGKYLLLSGQTHHQLLQLSPVHAFVLAAVMRLYQLLYARRPGYAPEMFCHVPGFASVARVNVTKWLPSAIQLQVTVERDPGCWLVCKVLPTTSRAVLQN